MSSRTILLVEDDAAIRRGVADALGFEGYKVLQASEGLAGMKLALESELDLILLDVVLPGATGIEILTAVRRARPTAPIIMLTAMGDETDRVQGLKLGADDYIVKPFSIRELLARIAAVLRRSAERPTDVKALDLPGGTADLIRREIRFADGGSATLTDRECELLRYIAAAGGRPVSREEILSRIWRLEPSGITTRTIDMHIARLREKLRDDPAEPSILLTVRGKGYRFIGQESAP